MKRILDGSAARPRLRDGNFTRDRARQRIEISVSEMHIGLQVCPFAPLVPGIDADKRLAEERPLLRQLDQPLKPALESPGRRIRK